MLHVIHHTRCALNKPCQNYGDSSFVISSFFFYCSLITDLKLKFFILCSDAEIPPESYSYSEFTFLEYMS